MKVLQFTIPVPGDKNIIVVKDLLPHFYPHLHRHDEIQLTWVQKGEGTLVVDNNMHPFGPNEIYLIGANQPHVFKSDASYFGPKSKRKIQALSIHFNPNGKLSHFFELAEMKAIKSFLHKYRTGFNVPENYVSDIAHKMMQISETNGIDQLIALVGILKKFSTIPEMKELSNLTSLTTVSEHEGIRLGNIYNYIMLNYAKPITLEDVSKQAHMTPQAFCRYFKKRTLHTFVSFLNEVRINEACKILTNGNSDNICISTIAYNCGFNTVTNFNRVFKSIIGKSPSEYLDSYFRHTYEDAVSA